MSIKENVKKLKSVSPVLAASGEDVRNKALKIIADSLLEKKDKIFAANKEDMSRAKESGISDAVLGRLKFDEGKLSSCIDGIETLISLPDPVGKIQLKRALDTGLILTRKSVPIGVIGVIFEARPDALIQISTLCIKSANSAVLKGGKETASTNKVLFDIIYEAALFAGLPEGFMLLATAHEEIDELLSFDKDVDLLIPRGSNAFVKYIMDNTKIPVMGHADGICHTYLDKDADIEKSIPIIVDAKIQYPAACNATETLLVDKSLSSDVKLRIKEALIGAGVKVEDEAFAKEYLDLVISFKEVDGVKEAVDHINTHGSHHTDAILTENDETAEYFMQMVDSAGVYRNCSTRFADGFRYGFGAEVGISTSKIHARGPVGLEGLMTYKYTLEGSGQIVADYASGKSRFDFKDL